MRINDYEFMNPFGTAAGDQLKGLGRRNPLAAERLIRAMEDFASTNTDLACKVIDRGDVEIFLVPPRYVLAHVPDAAVLIRVDHAGAQIDVIEIFAEYGGYDEPVQWEHIKELALGAV